MNNKEMLEEIKNNLTTEQIYDILSALGGNPIEKGNLIISQTICHGGHSHKLYYYDNTKLFKCYTDCPEDSFDIFELIIKIKKLDGIDLSFGQAISFIIKYFNLDISFNENQSDENNLQDWKILNQYEKNKEILREEKIVELKIYNKDILKNLPHPRIIPWENEGITKEVMKHFEICYDPVYQGIVIPHFNIDNDLIGIRERTLIKEEEKNGKYKPAILNYQMYNHPLGFNLYGLNESKKNIKAIEKAIIFEGEKSVLLYASYFGIDNNISVAVCGSNLTKFQVKLLLDLGVKEICIAFDKQFQEIGNEEWKRWTEKLKGINKKYSPLVQISFLFDKEDNLSYKDSPIDQGPETFLKLFEERIVL